jgi:hypothetical protein
MMCEDASGINTAVDSWVQDIRKASPSNGCFQRALQ